MNRPYNFRMPSNSGGDQYGMMATPITAPAPDYNARIDPLVTSYGMMATPITAPAPASQTSGSLELSDPYLRELMRYYSPSAQPMAQPMAQPQSSPMPQSNEEGLKLDPYMQELIRRYQPSMPQMPAGLSPMSRPQSSQANAFFTL